VAQADEVEIFVPFSGQWVDGYELADQGPAEAPDAYWIRRQSDGVVLPEVVPATRIRPAHSLR
jgi:hypothetical protein